MLAYYTRNDTLTTAEGEQNALCIYDFFVNEKGWTPNAVCGMLGNMWYESQCNPGRWQNSDYGNLNGGYGIVQWTKATKYINWADSMGYDITLMEGQVERILYELAMGIQYYKSNDFPITFYQFAHSLESPYYLGGAFLRNYERPASYMSSWSKRGGKAEYFYTLFTGMEFPKKSKKLSLLDLIIYTRKGR